MRTNTSTVLPEPTERISKSVIHIYKNNRNVTRNKSENMVMALYLPSAFGRVGKKGKLGKADEIYYDFISVYQDTNVEQRERLSRIKRSYQLRVVLFTQARKQDPDKEPF
ncbi:MAG: hypothetical protein ACKPKO_35545 [Candidatus Fonsibacter sp.]